MLDFLPHVERVVTYEAKNIKLQMVKWNKVKLYDVFYSHVLEGGITSEISTPMRKIAYFIAEFIRSSHMQSVMIHETQHCMQI